jgi:LPXTG-motif cell wall-anchored protein
MNKKIAAAYAAAATASGALIAGVGAPAGAAASCDAADFTVDGVFDLDGYLACTAGTGGGLPSTGSSTLQIAGIALGLLTIGGGFLYSANRKRSDAAS